MKVFLSSLIIGMEAFRAAAREALTTLRHEPIMAEEFGAQPNSPQVACLTGLRQSDVVVLILGEHYGAVQPSGLSDVNLSSPSFKKVLPAILNNLNSSKRYRDGKAVFSVAASQVQMTLGLL
jgi:hypothetical protein